ncbi:phospholipid:diacylglycerol acyltransferase [Pleurotus eryngii]|uniref:Phospholipid:diacylglycerol acyltransferase n=1 Tax=Pleurotus eryngii TaxID=5323 RepID=A0A9P6A897_PLEER|nr:phospholipid:diacylglycerol acyltransferase [Pleurotus eryngii]
MVLTKRTKTWENSDSAQADNGREHKNRISQLQESLHDKEEELETRSQGSDKEDDEPKKRSFFATRKFLFTLGICLGTLIAMLFIQANDIEEMHAQLAVFMNEFEISVPQLPDLDLSRVREEWSRLRNNIPEVWKFNRDGREFQVGEMMKARDLSAEYPVVLVPGIVSTGLESWSTSPDYRAFFREKLWGGFNMVSQVTFNKEKWIAAMMLDPITGLDPPDAKIRAAEGFDAASTFIQGYWLWSKIIENLAVVNYDSNNLHLAPYDWRLSFWNLEERDGYFSKLKSTIEGYKRRQRRKTVIAAHSMGANVFKWVESPEHGGGGPDWVENHIEAFVSIAGTHLGVAKAMAALLSGEMKDTVQMNPAGAYVLERFFSMKERRKLFRSWAGAASMWIKGGSAVWGNSTNAPDDLPSATLSHGQVIAFRDSLKLNTETVDHGVKNMTADEAGAWILEHTPSSFQKMIGTNYSYGIERDAVLLDKNDLDHTKWANPLEARLPRAPSMKIYCVYGHGKDTERSYWYVRGRHEYDDSTTEPDQPRCIEPEQDGCQSPRPPLDMPMSRRSWIDSEYTDERINPKIINGVKMGEGDGTVSLLSLGAMCVEGWKRERWNPAGIPITTVELPHQPVASIPRGGANTSDHVDVLGSTGLNEIILKVATGVGHEVQDNFVSNIREYAKKIQWD